MKRTALACLRFLGWGALWFLIALLIVPTLVLHWLSGAGLWVVAELKARADELIGAQK